MESFDSGVLSWFLWSCQSASQRWYSSLPDLFVIPLFMSSCHPLNFHDGKKCSDVMFWLTRPIKPQKIGWNESHGEWHLKIFNNKQSPNNNFSSSYLHIHTKTCYLNDPPCRTRDLLSPSYQPKYSQQISQDEGPFRAGQSAMDRFLLVVQCVIGGGKVKANHFQETIKCLFAIVVARGWMTSWICQTSWNYLERLHKSPCHTGLM